MDKVNLLSLRFFGAALLALICIGGLYQYVSTKLDEYNYPAIGKMVDVGGYKLHMIDEGTGGPVIVIDAGLGQNSFYWALVYPEIAKFTRVVVVDRAGHNWSDASPLVRTSENIVKELHAILKNGNVPEPYILVGHSFGGLNVRLYASTYSDEVAGVVLVDASHENQNIHFANMSRFGDTWSDWKTYCERYLGVERFIRQRAAQQPDWKKSIEMIPEEIQNTYLASRLTSKFMEAKIGEANNFGLSCDQLQLDGGLIGDKPLVVITAGKKKSLTDEKKKAWHDLQTDLVLKSSQGTQVFAERSGHNINIEQPEIIVDVVRKMVEGLRKEK